MRNLSMAIVLSALLGPLGSAQEVQPLDLIPQDAAFVVRLQAPELTLASLEAFVEKVQPGFGFLAKAQASTGLGQAIRNPGLTGVDMTRDWYFAVIAESKADQNAFLLLPVSDADAFKDATGEYQFLVKDDWIVCSVKEEAIQRVQACIDGDVSSFGKQLNEDYSEDLMAAHLGCAINATSLKQAFAEELSSADEKLDKAIDKLGEQLRQGNAEIEIDYIKDLYRDVGGVGLQVVRDAEMGVLRLNLTDNDLTIESRFSVEKDSASDEVLKTQPVGSLARLANVPEGLTGYWAIHGDPSVLFDWAEKLTKGVFKEEDKQAAFGKMMALIRQMKFGTMSGGYDLVDGEGGAMRFFGINELTPGAKLRESFALLGDGMEYNIGGIKQKQTIELGAEELDGKPVDILSFEQTVPPELDPLGVQVAMNEKFYGPGGMTQRLMIQDDVVFNTLGGGLDAMKQLIATEASSDALHMQALGRHHDMANLVALADLPNMIYKMAKVILGTGVIPVPIQSEQLDGLRLAPSYAGFSAAIGIQHVHTRTTIPVESFQGFVQIGMFVQQLIGGGQ